MTERGTLGYFHMTSLEANMHYLGLILTNYDKVLISYFTRKKLDKRVKNEFKFTKLTGWSYNLIPGLFEY